jgi:hypothetical protein
MAGLLVGIEVVVELGGISVGFIRSSEGTRITQSEYPIEIGAFLLQIATDTFYLAKACPY